jgi:hypothetical protein
MAGGITIAADEVFAAELHSISVIGDYTTSIVLFKLGTLNSSYSILMFPEENLTTALDINSVRLYRASTTQMVLTYAYGANIDTSPSYSADTIYLGRIWRLKNVIGS